MKIQRPMQGRISSKFGDRIHPVTKAKSFHNGIDIAGPIGVPIVAPFDGVVAQSFNHNTGGLTLFIDHPTHPDKLQTRYCHLDKIHVKVGDRVKQGQLIADNGNTGRSTGPHLHFGIVRKGIHVDPELFI